MNNRFRHALLLSLALFAVFVAPRTGVAQEVVQSSVFHFGEIEGNRGPTTLIRDMLRGRTHTGFLIDMHVTELAPGQAPHAPHRHVHEELLLLFEGELEVTIAGRSSRITPGSAAYVASNDEHGWRNVTDAPARYFVIALGEDTPAPAVPAAASGND